jgi:bifunctional UDP-N-acetylglucosamine pyrophosphorylase/glucosamine-1-phosphate N-acetyltransferase
MNKNNQKFTITNENELKKIFDDKTLKMKKNSKITFYGDLKIGQNVLIEGNVILGKKNEIQKDCLLKNVQINNCNQIRMSSLIENTNIGNNNIIGPFAFLRNKTKIKNDCIIAAYVEITRSFINNKTLISHRAFVGDVNIGYGSIIGAGVVFCNYNFKSEKKEKSIVGKNCKIGSNSTIIAPIKIKNNSIIPALTKFKKSN